MWTPPVLENKKATPEFPVMNDIRYLSVRTCRGERQMLSEGRKKEEEIYDK